MFKFDKYLKEAKRYIEKGDAVQAGEKLYRCGKEAIKLLAETFDIEENKKAKEMGRWYTPLLGNAAIRLSKIVDSRIFAFWKTVYYLHCEGFHERHLDVENVRENLKDIEELVEIAKKYKNERGINEGRDEFDS